MGNRRWTDEETEYLLKKYGRMTLPTIAKKLNRTTKGVESKALRLGLGHSYEAQGNVTAAELSRAIGRAKTTVLRWIHRNGLKTTLKITNKKRKFHVIKIKDFWEFAKENSSFMKWELYERGSLLPEPLWLDEEIKRYYETRNKNEDKHWTKTEECYLLAYYNQGKQAKEISNLIGRSEYAVRNRLKKLKVTNRMIKISWKPIEDEMLVSMRAKGMLFREIAEEMGRTKSSVQRRYKRMFDKKQVATC